MIRLIASDIDGTLLLHDAETIPDEVFDCIRALHARGILFCAASGRQYSSLRKLFAPVADDILYSCENGAIVYHNNAVLAKTPLTAQHAQELTAQICAQPDCEVLISGADTSYVTAHRPEFGTMMRDEVGNNVVVIDRFEDIPEPVIKISAWCEREAKLYEQMFAPVWNRHLNVAIAGKHWLDFTLAHKGTALAQISAALDIPASDMVVFGDNFNDVPMFRTAGRAYAMKQAPKEVQQAAHAVCETVPDTLRTLGLV